MSSIIEIVCSAVLVFEIVGMFSYINTKNCFLVVHDWVVLVWGVDYFEFIVFFNNPGPATAKIC
jgi:hypothetical protein